MGYPSETIDESPQSPERRNILAIKAFTSLTLVRFAREDSSSGQHNTHTWILRARHCRKLLLFPNVTKRLLLDCLTNSSVVGVSKYRNDLLRTHGMLCARCDGIRKKGAPFSIVLDPEEISDRTSCKKDLYKDCYRSLLAILDGLLTRRRQKAQRKNRARS